MTDQQMVLEGQVVEEVRKEVVNQLAVVEKTSIRSAQDLEEAKIVLGQVVTVKKSVQEKKDGILKPLNETLRNVRALFSPIEAQISSAEAMLKTKMLKWNDTVKKQNEVKTAEITKKVESGQMEFGKAGAKIEKLQEKTEAIPTRKIAKMEIVDENLVPEKFWVINESALRAAVLAAHKIGETIPGTKVVVEDVIVGRAY